MDRNDIVAIVRFCALIATALGIFGLSIVVVGWLYDEPVGRFLLYDLLFIGVHATLFGLWRKRRTALTVRSSILAVNAIWLLIGIAGALPLVLYAHVSWVDAFFESISGFTTTGATIFTDIESLPHTVLFARSLMHWLGGMGIIVLGVGLFSMINPSGSLSLFRAESTGIQTEKITPKIKDTALRLWGVYLLLTGLDTVALKLAGMGWFDAINHAFSTISTGGFSTKNASLGAFHSYAIVWITTFFMVVSGINFLAHLRFVTRGKWDGYKREEVFWYLAMFALLSWMLIAVDVFDDHDGLGHALTHATFTIASVMTTTGFATLDYAQWGHSAIVVIFVAMLIGGNAGSTAGGMKVVRLIVLFKNLGAQFRRTLNPNEIVPIFMDRRKLSDQTVAAVTGFVLLFVVSNVAVTVYLFAQGYDAMTSVSTALATVGNIGPGFALTGPAQNYAFFHDSDKIVLSLAMIAGRLEFYTLFLLFARTFWKRF